MTHISNYQCCKAANLWVDDEQLVCGQHATADHLRRLKLVEAKALTLGLQLLKHRSEWHTDYAWPLGPFNNLVGREQLIRWALKNKLTLSKRMTVCFHVLLFGRCSSSECVCYGDRYGIPSLNEAGGYDLDPSWMDHVTLWERDGKPVVLVNQPYLDMATARRFLQLDRDSSPLCVEVRKEGWYRLGSCFIAVWRDPSAKLSDPRPTCSACDTGRSGWWFVRRSTLEWHCNNCYTAAQGAGGALPDNDEWWHGHRAELRKLRSLAMFLRGWRDGRPPTADRAAPASTDNKE